MGIFKKKNEKETRASKKGSHRSPTISRLIEDISLLNPPQPKGYYMSWLRDKIDDSQIGAFLEKVDKAMGFEDEYGQYFYYADDNIILTLPWTEERQNDPFSACLANKYLSHVAPWDASMTFCKKSNLEDHLIAIYPHVKNPKFVHAKTWVEFFTELDKQHAKTWKTDFSHHRLPSNIDLTSDMKIFIGYRNAELDGYIHHLKKLKIALKQEIAKTNKDPNYDNTKAIDKIIESAKWNQHNLNQCYKRLKSAEKTIQAHKPLQDQMDLIHKQSKKGASKEIAHAQAATRRNREYRHQQDILQRKKWDAENEVHNIDYQKAKLEKEYIENEEKQNKIDAQLENEK